MITIKKREDRTNPLTNPIPKMVAIENTFVENNIPLVKRVNKMAMTQLPIKDFRARISVLPIP